MNQKKLIKYCAAVSMFSGLVILVSVVYPIASYEAKSKREYPQLISPITKVGNLFNKRSEGDVNDLTKASNWFEDDVKRDEFNLSNIRFYTITIPRLRIENATVSIGGENLADSLIQYPGTAVPGKIGNSVIFGHSILPIFYDPKNYLAIFSTLDKLESGDDIYIDYDGISYHYQVDSKFEVKPTDIQILDQDKDGSHLSLVTCTPPGHPLKPKRLVLRASLVPYQNANADIRN